MTGPSAAGATAVRVAVVGHVEWVSFARVQRLPQPGEIVHALEAWEEAAGGGGVAAVQLARLAGACRFYTALGDDGLGRRAAARLAQLGVQAHVAWRSAPTRRAFTHTDAQGERTITVIGERMVPSGADALPWEELAGVAAVYFTGGDAAAVRAARAARTLVATPRGVDALVAADVPVDVLVYSGRDADEAAWAQRLADRPPRFRVATRGAEGGTWTAADGTTGTWRAQPLPGPVVDAYGCGDSFAAGLTLALGAGRDLPGALEFGAACGAACLTGRGPYGSGLPRL